MVPLIIETNCNDVVHFVFYKKSSRTEIFWAIIDIQYKVERKDNMFKIQHISRDCNTIDHALAKIILANECLEGFISPSNNGNEYYSQ